MHPTDKISPFLSTYFLPAVAMPKRTELDFIRSSILHNRPYTFTSIPLKWTLPHIQFSFLIDELFYPLSITSRIMSKLMQWRNTEIRIFTDEMIHVAKAATTELLLPALTVAAVVESVAYLALFGVGMCVKHITDKPLEWSKAWASSLFTIRWTVNMLYHNLYSSKLPVEEY